MPETPQWMREANDAMKRDVLGEPDAGERMTEILDDAQLGAALRAALAECPPDHPLWRPKLQLTPEGTVEYWTPRGGQQTNATRLLASLLAGAPQRETP